MDWSLRRWSANQLRHILDIGPILTPNLTESLYIPSSQGEETTSDEDVYKQLRIYRSAEGSADDVQIHQWVEKRRLLPGEREATDFHHVFNFLS